MADTFLTTILTLWSYNMRKVNIKITVTVGITIAKNTNGHIFMKLKN